MTVEKTTMTMTTMKVLPVNIPDMDPNTREREATGLPAVHRHAQAAILII